MERHLFLGHAAFVALPLDLPLVRADWDDVHDDLDPGRVPGPASRGDFDPDALRPLFDEVSAGGVENSLAEMRRQVTNTASRISAVPTTALTVRDRRLGGTPPTEERGGPTSSHSGVD